jgi:hypothetical protein
MVPYILQTSIPEDPANDDTTILRRGATIEEKSYCASLLPSICYKHRPEGLSFRFGMPLQMRNLQSLQGDAGRRKSPRPGESSIDYGLTIRLVFVQPVIQDVHARFQALAWKFEGDDMVSMNWLDVIAATTAPHTITPQAESGQEAAGGRGSGI